MFEDLIFSMTPGDEVDFMSMFSIDEGMDKKDIDYPSQIPLLALKNTVLFPGVIIPITVGRDKSVKVINTAYKGDRLIGVLSQMDLEVETPGVEDLFKIGTVAKIVKILKLPDGTLTAILQGKQKFVLDEMVKTEPMLEGRITMLEEED